MCVCSDCGTLSVVLVCVCWRVMRSLCAASDSTTRGSWAEHMMGENTHTLIHSTICFWQAVHLWTWLITSGHNSPSHSLSSSAGKLKFGIYRQLWILGPLPARYVCVHSWCVWIMPSSYLCFVIFFNSTINILVVVTFTYDKTYQPQDVTTSLFFLLVTSVSLK